MMYVKFMKNFLLADSSEQMAVGHSFRCTSSSDSGEQMPVNSEPKTFDSYFLDMMYVEFMKNFLLADSGEQMPVRLISASWAQKRLIPTF